MPRSGEKTKKQILDAAHELVMGHGLAGTSIDKVLAKAQVTKGAFFYHFKTKADLAKALVQRYVERERLYLEGNIIRAEKLSRDPLQQVLILIGLYREEIEQGYDPNDGCLVSSYTYQFEDLDAQVQDLVLETFARRQQCFTEKFVAVLDQYTPRFPVTAEELADGLLSMFLGGYILMRVKQDPLKMSMQLASYRNYIELLFAV